MSGSRPFTVQANHVDVDQAGLPPTVPLMNPRNRLTMRARLSPVDIGARATSDDKVNPNNYRSLSQMSQERMKMDSAPRYVQDMPSIKNEAKEMNLSEEPYSRRYIHQNKPSYDFSSNLRDSLA